MKICLFADAQSVHIRQLSYFLARCGHLVHIVTHKPAEMRWASVETFAVPQPGLTNPRRWSARRDRYLRGFFRAFDIVNVHFLTDWTFKHILEGRGPGDARLIATAWGSDIVDPPGEGRASAELVGTRRNLLQSCDAVTTCGPSFAKTVAAYANLPLDSIDVVPFGVNLQLFQASRVQKSADFLRVGYFKGFRAVYGPTTLMLAMPSVLESIPNVRFEMIGDGGKLTECQAMARDLGINSSVEWKGRLEHADLPGHLARWELSVIPSVHEAFGVAALESQAMGVPVVASAMDGLHDTVRDGETGLHVPPGDPAGLAGAVVRLLRDHKLRGEMAAAGREWVSRKFDWQKIVHAWSALYGRVREHACVMT